MLNTEEGPRVKSMYLEDELRLTEEERAILDDSVDRPTSDMLFNGVR